jgi:hypothetical protein
MGAGVHPRSRGPGYYSAPRPRAPATSLGSATFLRGFGQFYGFWGQFYCCRPFLGPFSRFLPKTLKPRVSRGRQFAIWDGSGTSRLAARFVVYHLATEEFSTPCVCSLAVTAAERRRRFAGGATVAVSWCVPSLDTVSAALPFSRRPALLECRVCPFSSSLATISPLIIVTMVQRAPVRRGGRPQEFAFQWPGQRAGLLKALGAQ